MYKTTIARAKKVIHLADGENFYISDGVNFYPVFSQDFIGVEFNSANVKTWLKMQGVIASPKYYLDDTLNFLSKPF